MPHIAALPAHYHGKPHGDGHCVALVRALTDLPATSQWRRGEPVRGTDCEPGTAIATFDDSGRYANAMDNSSHAAILLGQHEDNSITVYDQWLNQPPHQRVIRNRDGLGYAVNDASRFYVIEVAA